MKTIASTVTKSIVKYSFLIPAAFLILLSFIKPELHFSNGLRIYSNVIITTYSALTVIHLFFPLKERFADGGILELSYNTFPVTAYLLLTFSQWHENIALCLTAAAIVTSAAVPFIINYRKKPNCKYLLKAFKTLILPVLTLTAFIPNVMSVFVYELKDPLYEARSDVRNDFAYSLSEETSYSFENSIPADYSEHTEFLQCFSDENWKNSSSDNKLSHLQTLTEIVSNNLAMGYCPQISAKSLSDDGSVLGTFDTQTGNITIDIDHLENDSARDVCIILLHETFHSYQSYIVSRMCNNPLLNTPAFDTVRIWGDNLKSYNNDYGIEYVTQPLEASSRAYAEKEMEKIFAYIS